MGVLEVWNCVRVSGTFQVVVTARHAVAPVPPCPTKMGPAHQITLCTVPSLHTTRLCQKPPLNLSSTSLNTHARPRAPKRTCTSAAHHIIVSTLPGLHTTRLSPPETPSPNLSQCSPLPPLTLQRHSNTYLHLRSASNHREHLARPPHHHQPAPNLLLYPPPLLAPLIPSTPHSHHSIIPAPPQRLASLATSPFLPFPPPPAHPPPEVSSPAPPQRLL